MKYSTHLIIGAGVVGKATGKFLEAHGQTVWYNDIDKTKLQDCQRISYSKTGYSFYWICTHEKDVEEALDGLPKDGNIIVRSTIKPNDIEKYEYLFGFKHIAHIPEFLTEANAIDDEFKIDRFIIGTTDVEYGEYIGFFLSTMKDNIYICTSQASSLIKLTANAWLSTQISFWNDMYELYGKYDVQKQYIADAVAKDERISTYGNKMIHKPFGGMCLPKDINTLINISQPDLPFITLRSVRATNDRL